MQNRVSTCLLGLLLLPVTVPVVGQDGAFAVEGTAGFYIPDTGEPNTNRRLGWEAGVRMTYPVSDGWLAFSHFGYARADNTAVTGEHPERVFSGIEEQRLLAGPEYALSEHFAVALGAGAVARRQLVTDTDENPPPTNYPDGDGGSTSWGWQLGIQPAIAWRTDDVAVRLATLLLADHLSGLNVSMGLGVRLW